MATKSRQPTRSARKPQAKGAEPAVVHDIRQHRRVIETPPGVGEYGARVFQHLLDEFHVMRGSPLPSDVECIASAVRALETSLDYRRDADQARVEGRTRDRIALDTAARAEERSYTSKLTHLGITGRERGVKRTQKAAATLGVKRENNRWSHPDHGSI